MDGSVHFEDDAMARPQAGQLGQPFKFQPYDVERRPQNDVACAVK